MHPRRHALTRALFEGIAERAVVAETAIQGQLLERELLAVSDSLLVAADEIVDAQAVDVGIVCDALS